MTRRERQAYLRGVREGLAAGDDHEFYMAIAARRDGDTGGPTQFGVECSYGLACFLLWAKAGRSG